MVHKSVFERRLTLLKRNKMQQDNISKYDHMTEGPFHIKIIHLLGFCLEIHIPKVPIKSLGLLTNKKWTSLATSALFCAEKASV